MQFSPLKSNSHTCCCVFGCKSYAKKDSTLKFHRLPESGATKVSIINKMNTEESVDRRFVWEKVLKLQNNKKLSKNARVCSLHFTADDYLGNNSFTFKNQL